MTEEVVHEKNQIAQDHMAYCQIGTSKPSTNYDARFSE